MNFEGQKWIQGSFLLLEAIMIIRIYYIYYKFIILLWEILQKDILLYIIIVTWIVYNSNNLFDEESQKWYTK